MRPAPTRFARSGDARIAYQVFGQGSVDLVVVGGLASHLDLQWDEPSTVRLFERFASYVRLVRFDRRGTGLSDPTEGPPTLEQQMEDLDAVMDAAGLTRAALLGAVEAGLCAMYAASYPERVSALVLVNVAPAGALGGATPQFLDVIENHWGEGRMLPLLVPSRVGDRRFEEWWMRYERASASAAMTRRIIDLFVQTDLRGVLPSVRVPTLVLHSTDNRLVPVELGGLAGVAHALKRALLDAFGLPAFQADDVKLAIAWIESRAMNAGIELERKFHHTALRDAVHRFPQHIK